MARRPAPHLLLDAWDQARRQRPSQRAATILAVLAGEPDATALPIGTRDRRLFDVLQSYDGRQLTGLAQCPACGAAIEIVADASMLAIDAAASPFAVDMGAETVLVRLPDTTDVEAAASAADPARRLAERCLVDRRDLADDAIARINEAIFAADPLLDPEISVTCPSCAQDAAFLFDVASYLWDRIDARARQLLHQVDALARAYGWSEADILALPDGRRAAYLTMLDA